MLGQSKNDKILGDTGEKSKAKALSVAQALAHQDARFEKLDQVLFFIGFSQLDLGDMSGGRATLSRYVKQFPRHANVPDAYRILGDLSFDENRFAEAEESYKKVLEFPESTFVGYALYKLGWCAYNRGEFTRALLGLEKSLLWANETSVSSQMMGLRREARHDLVSIYAEVGDHHKALEYFTEWLLNLARQLDENGQFEKAQDLYQKVIVLQPSSPDNVVHQAAIIQDAYRLQRWEAVMESMDLLVEKYSNRFAQPAPELDPMHAVEAGIREVVMAHHFEFKESQAPEVISRTVRLDRAYLTLFSKWPVAQDPLYRHAHYLIKKERPKDALEAFQKYWLTYGNTAPEPRREEALRNLIHVLEIQEDALVKEQNVSGPFSSEAETIVRLSKEYEITYPANKYVRAISYLRSRTLLKYGRTEEGIELSQQLFDKDPADDIGKRSFGNLRVAYYSLKDWKRIYDWVTKLSADKRDQLKIYGTDLKTIREETYFLWAENIPGDSESAALFVKISEDPGMVKLREKSLYNAFIRYHKAGLKLLALQAAEKLQSLSPDYEGLRAAAGLRAALYQEAGDYEKAFLALKVFLANPGKDVSTDALNQAQMNAALISEALENWKEARALFSGQLKRQVSSVSGESEAERAIKRIDLRLNPAKPAAFKEWAELARVKDQFVRKPIPDRGELVDRIKMGAEKLQTLSTKFLDVAQSSKTPPCVATESYCSVPFLYEAYGKGVGKLAGKDAELEAELTKLRAPVEQKVIEFAQGCISQSEKAECTGPVFQEVVKNWGWKKDEKLASRINVLLESLDNNGPWLEPASNAFKDEADIIRLHMEGKATSDSWYALARLRLMKKKMGLSRLTIVDALSKESGSGRLLNGLAQVEFKYGTPEVWALFERAGEKGSAYAWVTLASHHLKSSRFEAGLSALKKALEGGAFKDLPEIKDQVKGLVTP
jgi:tetratricopeptide (TPR) repeat protein